MTAVPHPQMAFELMGGCSQERRISRRQPGEHPNAVNGRETHNIRVGLRLSRKEFDCLQALADSAGLYHSTMAAELLLKAMQAETAAIAEQQGHDHGVTALHLIKCSTKETAK